MNKVTIKHYKCQLEVDAIRSFLIWQGVTYEIEEGAQCLKDTWGKMMPVICVGDRKFLGYGNFMDYFKQEGWWKV